MLKVVAYFIFSSFLFLNACTGSDEDVFNKLNSCSDWKLKLSDNCSDNWQENWFMDGLCAKVEQGTQGMNFSAGSVNLDDSHHAVLWTRKCFKGDVKIEYAYTKTDTQIINVNILYIQASGIGEGLFDKDIFQWNKYREVPSMSNYYNNMNALHISYAAFDEENKDPKSDYIRIRQYPVTREISFKDTEIQPTCLNTGLFLPSVEYKITVIKNNSHLYLKVKGDNIVKMFVWDLKNKFPIVEGRIGLRHMFTRSANYSDFKIYTKAIR